MCSSFHRKPPCPADPSHAWSNSFLSHPCLVLLLQPLSPPPLGPPTSTPFPVWLPQAIRNTGAPPTIRPGLSGLCTLNRDSHLRLIASLTAPSLPALLPLPPLPGCTARARGSNVLWKIKPAKISQQSWLLVGLYAISPAYPLAFHSRARHPLPSLWVPLSMKACGWARDTLSSGLGGSGPLCSHWSSHFGTGSNSSARNKGETCPKQPV